MASEYAKIVKGLLQELKGAKRRQWIARAASVREREKRRDKLELWLLKFRWEWFATLTFRQGGDRKNKLGFCERRVRKWLHGLNTRIHGRAYRRQRTALYGVVAWERHRSGEWHAHLLMGNTGGYRRLTAMDDWHELSGYARVYRPSEKSITYVTKYVVKGGAWDPFGNWERDAQLRLS